MNSKIYSIKKEVDTNFPAMYYISCAYESNSKMAV